jgi:DUF4097 and DUF4098 domain-containing protein YvlB
MKNLKKFTLIAAIVGAVGCLTGCVFMSKTSYLYDNSENYTAGNREISDTITVIDLDYLSGDVTLVTTDSNVTSIVETSKKDVDDKRKVHTWVEGNTLHVRYCASARALDLNNLGKKLAIMLPAGTDLSNVELKVTSGDIRAEGFNTDTFVIKATSGDVKVDLSAKTAEITVTSGDILFKQTGDSDSVVIKTTSGEVTAEVEHVTTTDIVVTSGNIDVSADYVETIHVDALSGDSTYSFRQVPDLSDIDATSGNITVYLPEDADLTATFDKTSGDIYYELPFAQKDGHYICGSGTKQMSLKTTSGDIRVKYLNAQ